MRKRPEITEQTKANLVTEFWKILAKRKIEKITVKEITYYVENLFCKFVTNELGIVVFSWYFNRKTYDITIVLYFITVLIAGSLKLINYSRPKIIELLTDKIVI